MHFALKGDRIVADAGLVGDGLHTPAQLGARGQQKGAQLLIGFELSILKDEIAQGIPLYLTDAVLGLAKRGVKVVAHKSLVLKYTIIIEDDLNGSAYGHDDLRLGCDNFTQYRFRQFFDLVSQK